MDDVDVEVVIRRLVMHVELELVAFDVRVHFCRRFDEFGLHMLQPRDVFDFEVPQAPDVSSFHDSQEMESFKGLAVPVQVGQQKKALVARLA